MGKNDSGDQGAKPTDARSADARPVDARVARRRQDAIGRRLRQMYDDVVNEEIPDDFLSFLEKADDRTAGEAEDLKKKLAVDGGESKPAPVGRALNTEP